MAGNRYIVSTSIPRPVMKIIPSSTDILHTLKHGQRIDNLANKYYGDQLLSWIIMAGNPDYQNEFEILPGTVVRIPFPLQRVYTSWQIDQTI